MARKAYEIPIEQVRKFVAQVAPEYVDETGYFLIFEYNGGPFADAYVRQRLVTTTSPEPARKTKTKKGS